MRLLMVGITVVMCGMLIGCGSDTHVGLISDTIGMIDLAGTEVGNIKSRVNEAVKKVEEGKTAKLDLSDAFKAADKLKSTGDQAQIIKRKIEQVRSSITDDERKTMAAEQRGRLSEAFKGLLKQKEQLRQALEAADKINEKEVDKLREKIREAESPFEALARQ